MFCWESYRQGENYKFIKWWDKEGIDPERQQREVIERLAVFLNRIPAPVEAGIHLCYGRIGEEKRGAS